VIKGVVGDANELNRKVKSNITFRGIHTDNNYTVAVIWNRKVIPIFAVGLVAYTVMRISSVPKNSTGVTWTQADPYAVRYNLCTQL